MQTELYLNIQTLLLCLCVFAVLALLGLFLYMRKSQRPGRISADPLDALYRKLSEEIKFAVAPKFIELSTGVNELVELAVEIWRMEQRLLKSFPSMPDNQRKGLEISIDKLKRYIARYDLEIFDYTNQKYNEGMNLDVLSIEKDPSLASPLVKETIEPTVMLKGQVVRRAKIILLNNE